MKKNVFIVASNGFAILSILIIIVFQFRLIDNISEDYKIFWLSISYSYFAAFLFYLVTVCFPFFLTKKAKLPLIKMKVENIGVIYVNLINCFYAHGAEFPKDISDLENTERCEYALKYVRDWAKNDNVCGKTYMDQFITSQMDIFDEIHDLIYLYKEYIPIEQLIKLESLRKSRSYQYAKMGISIDIIVEAFGKELKLYNSIRKCYKNREIKS